MRPDLPAKLAEAMRTRHDRGVVRALVDWLAVSLRDGPVDATWRANFGRAYGGPAVRAALRLGYAEEVAAGLEAERGLLEKWGAWHAP